MTDTTPCRCGPEGCADSSCPRRLAAATPADALDAMRHQLDPVDDWRDPLARAAAELRRLAAEVDRAHEARRKAQAQREADYARLMAEAKREQRERGKAERERDALVAQMLRFESMAEIPHDELAALRADRDRLAAENAVLLAMLREARDTIDTLPGYPKGSDLCDRIDAIDAAKQEASNG